MTISSSALLLVASLALGADALSQRDTLLRFHNLANGAHWKNQDGWDTPDSDECTWHGIECDENKAVWAIDLQYNNLGNKISQHLWALPALKEVNLQGNLITDAGLTGFAADFETKAPLESLDLSENRLTQIDGIGSAPHSLRELHISANAFESRFPDELFRLTKLKILRASYNNGFVGPLSSEIGKMTNLRELSISFTNMHGSIPPEIGQLTLLEFLSLDNNRFRGDLPQELENLVNIKYLSITNSESERGAITGPLLDFKNNVNLKELYLNNNQLEGTIPSSLLENSLLTDRPVMVSLSDNRLRGKIPVELKRFEKLHLEVAGNKINGIPNELCNQKKWMHGGVASFGCDAILCPKGTYTASGRRESEDIACAQCPNGLLDAPHFGSVQCSTDAEDDYDTAQDVVEEIEEPETPAADLGSAATASASTEPVKSGLSGGAKFGIVAFSLTAFLALAVLGRRTVARRRFARELEEEAELDRAKKNGVVIDAADAGVSATENESGMLDIPLESTTSMSSGPSSPGVDRCIL